MRIWLTGGDTYTGRFLNENPIEFRPECKSFINTNHLPRTSDDTVFSSGRVKLIPFDRHFTPQEQDRNLKKLFRRNMNKANSHIISSLNANWPILFSSVVSNYFETLSIKNSASLPY